MKSYKKHLPLLLVSVIVALLCSCNGEPAVEEIPETPVQQPVTLQIALDSSSDIIQAGNSTTFRITNQLPASLKVQDITWYVNGKSQASTGSSFTLKTSETENIRYQVYAKINDAWFKGESNTAQCYGLTEKDNELYQQYIKTVYKYIDKLKQERNLSEIPGLSVSVYGKEGDVQFDLFEGLSSLDRKEKNTATTKHVLGSISKSITAASVVKTFLDKNYSFTEKTVGDFLGDAGLDEDEINMKATIDSVLKHTSGIGDFINVDYLVDLLSYNKSSIVISSIISRLASEAQIPSYPFNPWSPEKILEYTDSDDAVSGTTRYSSPGYVVLGMIVEKINDEQLNEYAADNLLEPLGLTGLLLAPQDVSSDDEYKNFADPHIFSDELSSLVSTYTQIPPEAMLVLNLIFPKDALYDFCRVEPSVNKIFCEASWSAGAFIGTSEEVAKWGYNLMSDNGSSVLDNVRPVIKASTPEDKTNTSDYGYGIKNFVVKDSSDANPEYFIGHEGRSVGTKNYMYYNEDTDLCFTVFLDSNNGGIDSDSLIYDLCNLSISE